MEQELKIAKMLVNEMILNLNDGQYNLAKKLLNSYENIIFNYRELSTSEIYEQLPYELLEHAEKLEEIKESLTEMVIPKLIKDRDYFPVETLTHIVNRLTKIYIKINSEFGKFKSSKNKVSKASKILKTSVDEGVLIAFYDEKHRGTGKTTEIIKQAHKNDATVIVTTHQNKRYLDELTREMGLNVDVRYIKSTEALRGMRILNNKFIVDEMVGIDVIKALIKNGNQLIGGFINLLNVKDTTKSFKEQLIEKLNKINNEIDILYATYGNKAFSLEQPSNRYLKLLHQRDVVEGMIKEENN